MLHPFCLTLSWAQAANQSFRSSIFPKTYYKAAEVTNLPNLLSKFVLFPHYLWSFLLPGFPGLVFPESGLIFSFFPLNSNGSRLCASPILQCVFGMVLACQGIWHQGLLFCPCVEWDTWRTILPLQTRAAQLCIFIFLTHNIKKRHLALLIENNYVHKEHTNCQCWQD